jgi:hypothetical protein
VHTSSLLEQHLENACSTNSKRVHKPNTYCSLLPAVIQQSRATETLGSTKSQRPPPLQSDTIYKSTTCVPPIFHTNETQERRANTTPTALQSSDPMQHTNDIFHPIRTQQQFRKALCTYIPAFYYSLRINPSFPHLPTEKIFTHMYLPLIPQTMVSPNNLNFSNLKQNTIPPRTAYFSYSSHSKNK